MEEFPSALPEAKPNDNKDKKKKSTKTGRETLRVPGIASLESNQKSKPAATESKSITDTLASLATKQPEAPKGAEATKPSKEDVPPTPKSETDTAAEPAEQKDAQNNSAPDIAEQVADTSKEAQEPSRSAETDAETADVEEDSTDYEALPESKFEPAPVEFSGGEVIIHLSGDTPVAERVLSVPEAAPTEQPEAPDAEAPIFTRQPEQQHQARSREAAPEPNEPEPTAGGNGGNMPPTPPPEQSPSSAEPEPEPYRMPLGQPEATQTTPDHESYAYYNTAAAPNVAPVPTAAEQAATKQEMEDALHRAARAGQNRGVVTGLFVGGLYEHFKHRKREKRQAKRFQQQTKQLEQTRQDQHFFMAEQATNQAASERQITGLQKELANASRPEKMQPNKVRPAENTPAEQLAIPPEHRLETSAWHTIEVDARTGKPVENPTFVYGHEYHRERAQENTPVDQRNAAAGELALVAVASAGAKPASNDDSQIQQSSPFAIPSATTQGPPPAAGTQSQPVAKDSKASDTPPPLWPWLAALVVVVICLIALLH